MPIHSLLDMTKTNTLAINKTVYKALRDYLGSENMDDSDYLFKSRKGNDALQSQAVSKLVKKWNSEIICKKYNHSSPAITMRYL